MKTFIDLFAGCGGLSEGFINAGFQPIVHVEVDKAACNTLRTRAAYHYLKSVNIDQYVAYLKSEINREQLYDAVPKEILNSIVNLSIGKANNDKIYKIIDEKIQNKKLDLIIGGPPCQAYSLVGRARSMNKMEGDSRNFLFLEYAKYLHRYKPKMFVFENVTGLYSADKGGYLRKMLLTFKNLGYTVRDFIVTAKDVKVLQDRKRIILVGYRKDIVFDGLNFKDANNDNYNVSVLLNDLPILQAGQGLDKYTGYVGPSNDYLEETGIRGDIQIVTQHLGRSHTIQDKQIYRIAIKKWNESKQRLNYNDLPEDLKTHTNRDIFTDRFKVVAADLTASQTVVAHIAKDGHYYIHPDIKQCRSLTVREAARLQSFPDNYYFEGDKEGMNRTAAYKQIGNAVPPLMARQIAEEIKKHL